ncbi:MAG: sugar transferase [Chitinophagales bacterium]|nr:sugar transferase [Chitinophagales bacterium]
MQQTKYIKESICLYAVMDYLTALFSWAIFFTLRKVFIEHFTYEQFSLFMNDRKFVQGLLIIPFSWLLLYYLTGTYTNIYLKSRVNELTQTLYVTVMGVVILFFAVLIDDRIFNYRDYYESIGILLSVHFFLTMSGRLLVLNRSKYQMDKGMVYFPTLFIGGNKRAIEVHKELNGKSKAQGYQFIGFIETNGHGNGNGSVHINGNGNGNGLSTYLPKMGVMADLEPVIRNHEVRQVVVAIESSEHHQLREILNQLADRNVIIKIVPDMYDILAGSVRMNHLLGASFIEIYPQLMSKWQYIVKRISDIIVSALVLIIFLPLYLFVALKVRFSSKGPIIYSQERIGIHGKPFRIYKFRSMYVNAETNGPLLSSHEDPRITSWGKIMRKWRLDELPQFFNVLKGEMSMVGPRPERKYYIDQILQQTTDYKHLHRVQPGITSLGMVKFGYAENVQQMISRMKYDLLYIENMSLILDLKILLYTFRTILQGRGK